MRIEGAGKSTGVGAFEEQHIWVKDGEGFKQIEPNHIKHSRTGNHWTNVWKDVPNDAIIVKFGNYRNGEPFANFSLANDSQALPGKDALTFLCKRYEAYLA